MPAPIETDRAQPLLSLTGIAKNVLGATATDTVTASTGELGPPMGEGVGAKNDDGDDKTPPKGDTATTCTTGMEGKLGPPNGDMDVEGELGPRTGIWMWKALRTCRPPSVDTPGHKRRATWADRAIRTTMSSGKARPGLGRRWRLRRSPHHAERAVGEPFSVPFLSSNTRG